MEYSPWTSWCLSMSETDLYLIDPAVGINNEDIIYQVKRDEKSVPNHLQNEKQSLIKNLIDVFQTKTSKKIVYEQNTNSIKDGLHLTEHKDGLFLNRRKIQKIEYIKYLIKSLFIKI